MRSGAQIAGIILLAGAAVALSAAGPGRAAPVAQFSVIAAQTPANGEQNYNGTTKGKLILTVPVGAMVQLAFKNQGTLPHSLQIIPFTTALPATALSAPAFPGAQVPNPQVGIQKGQAVNVQFTATKAGKYLMICGFPGHALLGMYATFNVDASPTAKPTMVIAK